MEWYEITSCVLWIILVGITLFIAICQAVEEIKASKEVAKIVELKKAYSDYPVCDACGEHHKQPNSQLCKDCEDKASDTKRAE